MLKPSAMGIETRMGADGGERRPNYGERTVLGGRHDTHRPPTTVLSTACQLGVGFAGRGYCAFVADERTVARRRAQVSITRRGAHLVAWCDVFISQRRIAYPAYDDYERADRKASSLRPEEEMLYDKANSPVRISERAPQARIRQSTGSTKRSRRAGRGKDNKIR